MQDDTPATSTVAPLMRNLAVLDNLLGRGTRAGLPLPTTAATIWQSSITLQWHDHADAALWADFLDIALVEGTRADTFVHHQAETTINGVTVHLAAFALIEVAV